MPKHFHDFKPVVADIDPAIAPDMLIDLRELAGTPARQFDAIYCSHNLERFYAHDVPSVLAGFNHVLRDDGFAEIRVPDLDSLMRQLIENDQELDEELYKNSNWEFDFRVGPFFMDGATKSNGHGKKIASHTKLVSRRSPWKKALNTAGFPIVIFRPDRQLEICALAFKASPTEFYRRRLEID